MPHATQPTPPGTMPCPDPSGPLRADAPARRGAGMARAGGQE
ncbi:MAG TPA: hypothetical protein VM890_17055 [Longimicrobium sp.]|nr:hypothetical protein [Longimicrobium sp.]